MVSQHHNIHTRLIPVEEDHVYDVYQLIDANRDHLRPWFDWVDEHTALENTLTMIQRAISQYTRGTGLLAGIWHEGQIIGCVGYETTDNTRRMGQLTFWIAEHYQGYGLATRSVRSIIRHCFYKLRFYRLEIRCAEENTRAVALAERLGFQREGTLRNAAVVHGQLGNVAVYGLLPSDWRD